MTWQERAPYDEKAARMANERGEPAGVILVPPGILRAVLGCAVVKPQSWCTPAEWMTAVCVFEPGEVERP